MTGNDILFVLAVSILKIISCDQAVCMPPMAKEGESAHVTCHFDDDADLSLIAIHKIDDEKGSTGRSLLECYKMAITHECFTPAGYKCECKDSSTVFLMTLSVTGTAEEETCVCELVDKLTLIIWSVTKKHAGKYVCQRGDSDPDVCYLRVKDGNEATTTNLTEGNESTPTNLTKNRQDGNSKIVVGSVAGACAALVLITVTLFIFSKSRRGKCQLYSDTARNSPECQPLMKPLQLPCRLLIIGKTGNGKSTTGNTLLKKDVFRKGSGLTTTTTTTTSETAETPEYLEVMDTFDVSGDSLTRTEQNLEVMKWKDFICNSRGAILLAIRCDAPYRARDYQIYQQMKSLWGDSSSFCQRLVVAFTFGDLRKHDFEEELTTASSQELKNVLEDASNRYVIFNNVASPLEKEEAVNKVLSYVDTLNESHEMNEEELILIVMGKTGNGKSSVVNSLLGRRACELGSGMSSATREAQVHQSGPLLKTAKLTVVDTPDISDTRYTDDQRKDEVSKWRELTDPGPHAILLTVRCDVRYTAEEYDIFKQLKKLWGNSFCKLLVVTFTFGDRLDGPLVEAHLPNELKSVLNDAAGRSVVINNRPGNQQATIEKISRFVRETQK